MKWTEKQQETIDLRNKNILVAAAAGSGKTAVLVERIKQLILKDRCSIDRMLIVTFTDAAASEMKGKIQKAINQAIKESDKREDIVFLKKQLELLPNGDISTFHAFALKVIRRFFYVINIEPNLKICDADQQTILKGQAMDELMETLFDEADPRFFGFLDRYSGDRHEKNFREIVDKIFVTINSLPEPYEWLHDNIELLGSDRETFEKSGAMDALWKDTGKVLDIAMSYVENNEKMAAHYGMEAMDELNISDRLVFQGLKDLAEKRDFDALTERINQLEYTRISDKFFKSVSADVTAEISKEVKAQVKNNRDTAKKNIVALRNYYFHSKLNEIVEDINGVYEDGTFLEEVILKYRQLYEKNKRNKGVIDFNDIEHYAYKILKDPQAAEYYRQKFEHIFIDEYQDSNVIQEALVGKIKRDNNLFMVGDVKQSIYKFRLAEPEIFQAKYRAYADDTNDLSTKIDLNKNFRSKKAVIDQINEIFSHTMEGYDDNAALYMGDVHGEKNNFEPKLFLVDEPWTDSDQIDDELKNIVKTEKEALATVKIIKDNLGKMIFDSKQGVERPLEKRDVVILMRAVKNYGDIFYRVLMDNNLPAYVDDNDGFLDTMEINTMLCLLSLIDNEKQDIPLLTVLRSDIFGFTVDELVKVRMIGEKCSYYNALKEYAQGGDGTEAALQSKCCRFFESLEQWRKQALILPLDRFVWQLMLETGFYISAGAMPGGNQRQANLRVLVDKALNYSRSQAGSLYGFIGYIDAIKDKKVHMGQVKLLGEDDDIVRIMTIHKSKGLEFPMVIIGGYCKSLRHDSTVKGVAIHKDIGLGFPVVNYEEHWYRSSLLQTIINRKAADEQVAEEKRVLYVAMTRAKDMLYLLGVINNVDEALEKVSESEPANSSYFNMTGKVLSSHPGVCIHMTDEDLTKLTKGSRRNTESTLRLLDEEVVSEEGISKVTIPEDIMRRMNFVYPYERELTIKSKYSVSELNHESSQQVDGLARPKCFGVTQELTAAQIGTVTHKVLEKADLKRIADEGMPYVRSVVKRLVDEEFITQNEADNVDADRLISFAQSPLGRRITASPHVYKERQFNLVKSRNGDEIVVQGVVDCYFEEDGELVLVDYKTSHMRKGVSTESEKMRIRKYYQTQIDIYREALETICGKRVKEAYLYLTNAGEVVEM